MKFKTEKVELSTDDAKFIYGFLDDVPWEVADRGFIGQSTDLLFKLQSLLPKKQYDKLLKEIVERAR